MKLAYFKIIFLLAVALLGLSGCMTVKDMPLRSDVEQVELKNESVVIFSTRIMNDVSRFYQPIIITAVIVPEGATKAAQLLSFRPKEPFSQSEAGAKEYLLSANLAPGKYKLQAIRCLATVFPLIGSCELPMNVPIKIDQPGQVIYMGHINAVIRERKENERRAGPILPLIDQAVTGMSSGSFDVIIEDRFASDVERYRKTYPAIRNASVQKALFPAWVRPMQQ